MKQPRLQIHNLGLFDLSGFNGKDPLPTLQRATECLSDLDYHVSSGTILGIHRDNGFIPHDTDIDISVVTGPKDKAALEDEITSLMVDFELVRKITSLDRVEQMVFADLKNKRLLVDIEFYYTHLIPEEMTHIKPEGIMSMSLYKTEVLNWKGIDLKVPDDIDRYLEERYGDWKNPVPDKGDWKTYTTCYKPWHEVDDSLKIISLEVDTGGCGNYRVRQPLQMLENLTDTTTHIINRNKDSEMSILEALAVADVVLVRPGAESIVPRYKEIVKDYCEHNKMPYKFKWAFDIDDNTELISPYNYHYAGFGVEEFYDKNSKKWLWQDGVAGFDLEKNRESFTSYQWGMMNADLITVTTEKLREYALKYNSNVVVLPNRINDDTWWKLPLKQGKKLRIGWSGGLSHYEDWHSIKDAINKLMRKHNFTLVLFGQAFPGLVDDDLQGQVESHPWVDFKAHSYRSMCMNLDIAVIPLADGPFNEYKSPIKYLEFSAMGVPCVVRNMLPYSEVINNENAMPYSTEKQFEQQLEKLIIDAKLRREISSEAMRVVKTGFLAQDGTQQRIDAYRSIS